MNLRIRKYANRNEIRIYLLAKGRIHCYDFLPKSLKSDVLYAKRFCFFKGETLLFAFAWSVEDKGDFWPHAFVLFIRNTSLYEKLPQERSTWTPPLHHRCGIKPIPAPCLSLAERPGPAFLLVNSGMRGIFEGAWPRRVRALQIRCKRCIRERCWCWCWWCENNFTPETSFSNEEHEDDNGLRI